MEMALDALTNEIKAAEEALKANPNDLNAVISVMVKRPRPNEEMNNMILALASIHLAAKIRESVESIRAIATIRLN